MSEWISVNDRIPPVPIEEGDAWVMGGRRNFRTHWYLVTVCRGDIRGVRIARWRTHIANGKAKKTRWMESPFKHCEVTHWMPLPGLPPI